jgi:hypothetical protein
MHTYEQIVNDPNWFIFHVKMNLNTFFTRFNSVSEYYRKISNSTSVFLGKTNRQFFKTIDQGFYRTSIDREMIGIHFFFRFSDLNRVYFNLNELGFRMKKIQYCKIEVYSIDLMNLTDKMLLESEKGINFYQKIKGTYKNSFLKIK